MPLSDAEFEELATENCPYCKRGNAVRYRSDMNEYVHDDIKGTSFYHSICLSNGMRKARAAQNNG